MVGGLIKGETMRQYIAEVGHLIAREADFTELVKSIESTNVIILDDLSVLAKLVFSSSNFQDWPT